MKTIEERAKEIALSEYGLNLDKLVGYLRGAKEQRDIDIEKACEWLACYGDDARWENPQDKIKEFRRAMKDELI